MQEMIGWQWQQLKKTKTNKTIHIQASM